MLVLLLFVHIAVSCLTANAVAVSVVDAYRSPASGKLQSLAAESEPTLLPTASSGSDVQSERRLAENSDADRAVGGTNIAAPPPRKRIKLGCSSPTDNSVDIRIADGVTATAQPVCSAAVFTPVAAAAAITAPSLCLAQGLPLTGRIIGTVWQPVQSQSTTTAVSTADGSMHPRSVVC